MSKNPKDMSIDEVLEKTKELLATNRAARIPAFTIRTLITAWRVLRLTRPPKGY